MFFDSSFFINANCIEVKDNPHRIASKKLLTTEPDTQLRASVSSIFVSNSKATLLSHTSKELLTTEA
jgi:hypothetical protein